MVAEIILMSGRLALTPSTACKSTVFDKIIVLNLKSYSESYSETYSETSKRETLQHFTNSFVL